MVPRLNLTRYNRYATTSVKKTPLRGLNPSTPFTFDSAPHLGLEPKPQHSTRSANHGNLSKLPSNFFAGRDTKAGQTDEGDTCFVIGQTHTVKPMPFSEARFSFDCPNRLHHTKHDRPNRPIVFGATGLIVWKPGFSEYV